jgi:membrane-associated HD superfamily phosphohydrolase
LKKGFMDGQLDECEITLHDLNKIPENFTRILNGIFHQISDYADPVIRGFNGGKK